MRVYAMEDLSRIPKELKVKIVLEAEAWRQVAWAINTSFEPGSGHEMQEWSDKQVVVMTFGAWKAVLRELVAFAVEHIGKTSEPLPEGFYQGKQEIELALVGLEEERIMRMEQGEG